jgi:hypothetical protein
VVLVVAMFSGGNATGNGSDGAAGENTSAEEIAIENGTGRRRP